MSGSVQAAQDISFPAMNTKVQQFFKIVKADPAVDTVSGSVGGSGGYGGSVNTARSFIQLKPLEKRKLSIDEVIARLRPKLAKVPGATLFLQPAQDIKIGGRQSNTQYQYTISADTLSELNTWAPKLVEAFRDIPGLRDVNSTSKRTARNPHW